MPDVLVGPLVAAEADAGAQQPLAPPQGARHHLQLPELHGLSAVHLHSHRLIRAGLQQLLQLVVLLVLRCGTERREMWGRGSFMALACIRVNFVSYFRFSLSLLTKMLIRFSHI